MKASKNRYDGFDEVAVIRKTMREIVDFKKCSAWQWEDFEQELIFHILKTKPKYESENEFYYAIKSIVRNKLINLEKWRHREKRNHSSVSSLNQKISIEYDETYLDIIPDEAFDTPDQISRVNKSPESIESALWKVVEDKPVMYEELLRLMLKHQKVAAVAREMGEPRTTVSYHWKKLKSWIEDAGLKELL